jgi:hypothetical protein
VVHKYQGWQSEEHQWPYKMHKFPTYVTAVVAVLLIATDSYGSIGSLSAVESIGGAERVDNGLVVGESLSSSYNQYMIEVEH